MIYYLCTECGIEFPFNHIKQCAECGSGQVSESYSKSAGEEQTRTKGKQNAA